jgi:hypothetical protein
MAAELVDRMATLVPVRRFILDMGAADSHSLRFDNYVRMQYISFVELLLFLFGVFGGDLRREFMQRLSLHGTLGSYLRDALQEGSAEAVACLPSHRT